MNLSINGLSGFSVFSQRFGTARKLKSTQDKLERQQKAQSQIEFFENQKENLKNMQCDSIEEIARKLEMFHSYEDQIAAVKKQYNNEQMFHTMDEARERGEQIAELAEDYAPKNEEERKEEMVEEALGIEEKGGITESMEEVQEITEDMVEELTAENLEVVDEAITEESEVFTEAELLLPEEVKYKRRYTYQSQNYFESKQYVKGNGKSLHIGTDSLITALLIVEDTEVKPQYSVYGKTEFMQLVGITESELQAILADHTNIDKLIELMKADGNLELVTDMKRTKCYL